MADIGFNQEPMIFSCSACSSNQHVRKLRASIMVPGEKSARGSITAFVCKHCLESVAQTLHARIEWQDSDLRAETKYGIDLENRES